MSETGLNVIMMSDKRKKKCIGLTGENETESDGTSLDGLYTVVTANDDDNNNNNNNGNVMEHRLRVFESRVLREIKSMKDGQEYSMRGERKGAYRFWVGKPEGKRPPG